jgi:hypothetical protein
LQIPQAAIVLIEPAIGQALDHMLDVCQHADALSRQAKMLAELRRGHARDWHRPPGDGPSDGPCGMIVGRWIGHRFGSHGFRAHDCI